MHNHIRVILPIIFLGKYNYLLCWYSYIWYPFNISGITRLNKRASQDVAVLGLGFLKLDGTCFSLLNNKLICFSPIWFKFSCELWLLGSSCKDGHSKDWQQCEGAGSPPDQFCKSMYLLCSLDIEQFICLCIIVFIILLYCNVTSVHIIKILKERAESDLKKAADQHWSDGALEVYYTTSFNSVCSKWKV